MVENLLVLKSRAFALKVVQMYRALQRVGEQILSKQLLRAGTSIGANIAEGQYAQSKADFVTKYTIALKEASETDYWLELILSAGCLPDPSPCKELIEDNRELLRLLITSVKKLKGIHDEKQI